MSDTSQSGEPQPGEPQPGGPQSGEPQPSVPQPWGDQPHPAQRYPAEQHPAAAYPAQPYPAQPYPGQAYPAPTYGQHPYGQQGYGQPPYGQQGYGYGPPYGAVAAYPAPVSHTRRNVLLIVAGAIAVVAAIAAIGAYAYSKAGTPAGPTRRLALPPTSGPYSRTNGSGSERIASAIESQLAASGAPSLRNALVGVYSDTATDAPALVVLAASAQHDADFARELRSRSAKGEAATVFKGAGASNIADYDAGPLGGVLQCGTITVNDLCVWVDKSTLGLVIGPNQSTMNSLAADTLQLRNDTEH